MEVMRKEQNGYRLSPQQSRLWRLWQGTPEAAFRSRFIIEIRGNLNRDRLEEALNQVVERHEILRASFQRIPELTVPLQMIHDEAACNFRHQDIRHLRPSAQDERISGLFEEDEWESDGLSRNPCFEATLPTIHDARHSLLIRLPSICSDAKTGRIPTAEIAEIYRRLGSDEAVKTPDANPQAQLQYAQFVEWQNELLEGDASASGREFWQSRDTSWRTQQIPFENGSAIEWQEGFMFDETATEDSPDFFPLGFSFQDL